MMKVFGPVPSRRLGRSLGVNNVAPKSCTYSCVYCQLGHVPGKLIDRRTFGDPRDLVREIELKAKAALDRGERIDYVAFVPDGEPTLDAHLGRELERVRALGFQTAVITNASLLSHAEVRRDLGGADWLSLKVDSLDERLWRRMNRPHPRLDLEAIRRGMVALAEVYPGRLTTETMLVAGLNDAEAQLDRVARFLAELDPSVAYLSVPTRPPASRRVRAPSEAAVARAYDIFSRALRSVECLTGYEGDAFARTGDVIQDLLSITAVHPMRREAVEAFLEEGDASWEAVREAVERGELLCVSYDGHEYVMRQMRRHERP